MKGRGAFPGPQRASYGFSDGGRIAGGQKQLNLLQDRLILRGEFDQQAGQFGRFHLCESFK